MIDRSEFIIAGVYRDYGGAFKSIQYASKADKNSNRHLKKIGSQFLPEKAALFA